MKKFFISFLMIFMLFSVFIGKAQGEEDVYVICDIQFNKHSETVVVNTTENYVEEEGWPAVSIIPGSGNTMEFRPTEAAGNHCDWLPGALRYNNNANAAEITFNEPVSKLVIYGASGSGTAGNDVGLVVQLLKASDRSVVRASQEVKLGLTSERTGCLIEIADEECLLEPFIARITRTVATLNLMRIYAEGFGTMPESKDNSIKSLTIDGKTATIDNTKNEITVDFTATGVFAIEYALNHPAATADFENGTTHDFENPLLIKVTAENGDERTYTVTVNVIASGIKKIGMLVASSGDYTGKSGNYSTDCHERFMSIFDESLYLVTELPVLGGDSQWGQLTNPEDKNSDRLTRLEGYDLIVVHPSVSGRNDDLLRLVNLIGDKPILNIKPFAYTTGSGNNDRWGWAAPANAAAVDGPSTVQIDAELTGHPILNGVLSGAENDEFALFSVPCKVANNIQTSGEFNGNRWTEELAAASNVLAKFGTGALIHEINLDNAAKYLMVGISWESQMLQNLSDDAIKMLKNALDYLANPDIYYDYENNVVVGGETKYHIIEDFDGKTATNPGSSFPWTTDVLNGGEWTIYSPGGTTATVGSDILTVAGSGNGNRTLDVGFPTNGTSSPVYFSVDYKVENAAIGPRNAMFFALLSEGTTSSASRNDQYIFNLYVCGDDGKFHLQNLDNSAMVLYDAGNAAGSYRFTKSGADNEECNAKNASTITDVSYVMGATYKVEAWLDFETKKIIEMQIDGVTIAEDVDFLGASVNALGRMLFLKSRSYSEPEDLSATTTSGNGDFTITIDNFEVREYDPGALSDDNFIRTLTIDGKTARIDNAKNEISVVMAVKDDVYVVEYTLNHEGATADFVSGNSHDFTAPLEIKVTAENGSIRTYTVFVEVSGDNTIKSLLIDDKPAKIDNDKNEISVVVSSDGVFSVKYELNFEGATADFTSGDSHDFATPLEIKVTAANGDERTYTVFVNIMEGEFMFEDPMPSEIAQLRLNESVQLSWKMHAEAPTPDSFELWAGATEATLAKIDDVSSTPSIYAADGAFNFTYTPDEDFTSGEPHYWRVVAVYGSSTEQSAIWSFTPVEIEMNEFNYIDLGVDWAGTSYYYIGSLTGESMTGTNAQTAPSKRIYPGTNRDVSFLPTSTNISTDNRNGYLNHGGTPVDVDSIRVANFRWLLTDDGYITINLGSDAAKRDILKFVLNGTDDDLTGANRTKPVMLFSDNETFDAESIIGYENSFPINIYRSGSNAGATVEPHEPVVLRGQAAIIVEPPAGTKSIRLYTNVKLSQIGSELYKIDSEGDIELSHGATGRTIHVAYMGVELEEAFDDNSIKSFLIDGKPAIIDNVKNEIYMTMSNDGVYDVEFEFSYPGTTADFTGNSFDFTDEKSLDLTVTAVGGETRTYKVYINVADPTLLIVDVMPSNYKVPDERNGGNVNTSLYSNYRPAKVRLHDNIRLSWKPGDGITILEYEVYAGSSENEMSKIEAAISGPINGGYSILYEPASPFVSDVPHYWRVDAILDVGAAPITGTVWSFTPVAPEAENLVDLGHDYDGVGTSYDRAPGAYFTNVLETKVAYENTNKEVTFTPVNLNAGANDNGGYLQTENTTTWRASDVNGFAPFLSGATDGTPRYINVALTGENSMSRTIKRFIINGTDATPASTWTSRSRPIIVYSDQEEFDEQSIIGYEQITLGICRTGNSSSVSQSHRGQAAMIVDAPEGTKSARVYNWVKLTVTGDKYKFENIDNLDVDGVTLLPDDDHIRLTQGPQARIAYIGVELEPALNDTRIKELSINGVAARKYDHDAGEIEVVLASLGNYVVEYELNNRAATADFVSGAEHNFAEGPLTITVTAEGATMVYTVSVKVLLDITITLDPGEGRLPDGVSNTKVVRQEDQIGDLPVPIREGYDFLGWETETGNVISAISICEFEGDVTLYAQYRAKTYTIEFDTQTGGAIPNPANITNVAYGTTANLHAIEETWNGKQFVGWNDKADGTGNFYTSTTPIEPTASPFKLYAIWEDIQETSVPEFALENLNVYPNPVKEKLSISGLEGGEIISFINAGGSLCIQTKATGETEEINISNLPAGTYLVRINNGSVEKTVKIVVAK